MDKKDYTKVKLSHVVLIRNSLTQKANARQILKTMTKLVLVVKLCCEID